MNDFCTKKVKQSLKALICVTEICGIRSEGIAIVPECIAGPCNVKLVVQCHDVGIIAMW